MGNYTKTEEVLKEMYQLFLQGYSNRKLRDWLWEEKGYGEAQGYNILRKFKESFKSELENDIKQDKAEVLERYEDLYAKAIEGGQIKIAKEVNDAIMKLKGLDIKKIEAVNNVTMDYSNLPDEALTQIIDLLNNGEEDIK